MLQYSRRWSVHSLKLIHSELILSIAALLLWDHIITLGAEVSKIWSRKFSGPTVLYAFLRYGTLVEKIAVMLLASWYMTPRVSSFKRLNLGS